MYRNENITENSKTDYIDKNRYKNNILLNNPQNFPFPMNQGNKTQVILRNKENSFNNRNFENLPNSANIEYINSLPSNGLINIKDLSKGDYNDKNGSKNNNSNKNIYINNYNPVKKKCKIARNYEDITKYFSKNYKRNKMTNDNILTDFDSNDSKKNNVFYLINYNGVYSPNINAIYNSYNIEDNNNYNNKKYYKNNYNGQRIGKISLPFCVYNNIYDQKQKKQYICNDKNCPGCIYCLRNKNINDDIKGDKNPFIDNEQNLNNIEDDEYKNKLDNSFEENPLENQQKLSSKPNYINDKNPNKNSLIEEEDNDNNDSKETGKIEEEEKEEEEIKQEEIEIESSETNANEDIDNELSQRGSISIHSFINRIRLPHDSRPKNINNLNDKYRKKNKIDSSGKYKKKDKYNCDSINNSKDSENNRKAKSIPKRINVYNEDDDKRKRIKSTPKVKSSNESSIKKMIKSKKIEFLREY